MSSIVWIRNETFDHGVFNISVRWNVQKVVDFVVSLRQAVSSMSINRATWVETTTSRCKPPLSESEAEAFWHVITVLQQSVLGSSTDSVDFRTVGIILMCQVIHRGRTDHLAKSAELWPSHERSGGVSSPRHSPRGTSPRVGVSSQSSTARVRDSPASMIEFVKKHIGDFMQIVCLQHGVSASSQPTSMTLEEFNMLSLILTAGTSTKQPFAQLAEAMPDLQSKGSVSCKDIKQWLDSKLMWNEDVYGIPDTLLSRGADSVGTSINVSGLSKMTWFQKPSDTNCEFMSITSCTDCVIYLTSPVRFCHVAGCHDCTIIMVAVSAVCTLQQCEKTSVHVAAHSFKMVNCIDSSAYLFCHVPPLLTGDTRGIKLAPFNVLHSQITPLLAKANMSFDPSYVDTWSHPICCTLGSPDETLGGRGGSLESDNSSTYHFVHPKNFQPVVIPETTPKTGIPSSAQLCLPEVYTDAFKERMNEMRAFHQQIEEIKDEGKRQRAMQAIQGHFREWLQSTGKSRHLADLAKLVQSGQLLPEATSM